MGKRGPAPDPATEARHEAIAIAVESQPRVPYSGIAAEYGVSVGLVARAAARYGVARRGCRSDVERDAEIRRRYRDGEPVTEIAASYGLTRQRVHQVLKAEP